MPPVQHARRKVVIGSKAVIEEAIDNMVQQDILQLQIEPTLWLSSAIYPVKPSDAVRPCLDAMDLNKAIARENHKLQTVEEIAYQLAVVVVFMKGDDLKAFLQVHHTEVSSEFLVINTHKVRYWFTRMPLSQDVFQMKMDLIMEKCLGVINIVITNLINVAQLKGLVLNSKKLELKWPMVSLFGAKYSADGMHPWPKKMQGFTEMTLPTDKKHSLVYLHTWGILHQHL